MAEAHEEVVEELWSFVQLPQQGQVKTHAMYLSKSVGSEMQHSYLPNENNMIATVQVISYSQIPGRLDHHLLLNVFVPLNSVELY